MVEPVQQFDVISMGRIGVDLYPLQSGVPLAQVRSFGKFLGGSAANVAVAAARLGRSTAVITRTGADPFGTYLHETLTDLGVARPVRGRGRSACRRPPRLLRRDADTG